MKQSMMLALALLAGTAVAAPRESANLVAINGGPISSIGLINNPNNVTVSANFAGSDAGGAYQARTIRFAGTLASVGPGSFAREAIIRVQPPAGQAFYIQALPNGSTPSSSFPLTASHFALPVSGITTAGTWGFTFQESFDDVTGTGVDATWSNAVVTLDDATVEPPAVGDLPSVTFVNQASDGLSTAPATTLTWNNPTGGNFNAFRISGQLTATNNGTASSSIQVSEARVRVTPPGGVALTVVPVTAGVNGLSTATVDLTTAGAGSVAGTWTIELFESVDQPGAVDNVWNNLSLSLAFIPPPPAPEPLVDLGAFIAVDPSSTELVVEATGTEAVEVQWFKVQLSSAVTLANGFYLDLDTVGTVNGVDIEDTQIAIFDEFGEPLAEDDDSGPSVWSLLTFGSDVVRADLPVTPPATTAGFPRDGFNGELDAGVYYVAAASFLTTFDVGFDTVQELDPVSVVRKLNVRTNLSQPSGSPCGIADVGSEGGAEGADNILDNNDFIVFIQLFFASDARADIGTEGGAAGSDTFFDNNDFIVFIGAFFDGQSASGCNGNP